MRVVNPWSVAAILAAAVNLALGGVLLADSPDKAWFLLLVMGFVPGAWVFARLSQRLKIGGGSCACAEDLPFSLTLAGWLLASNLALKLAERQGLLTDASTDTISQALLGVLLVVGGNRMPKMLTPLKSMRCDPARTQAMQRFAGWTFVLAGVTLVVGSVILPAHAMEALLIATLATAGVLVLARKATLPKARARSENRTQPAMPPFTGG